MPGAIEISNVTRRFGELVAVDRLSLQVERGEIFALVGPDGAGKTTLLRLVCGALAMDEGSLVVDGRDVAKRPGDVQSAVGYMPQRFSLYPDLSLLENLRFYAAIFGVPAGEFKRRATELLDDFGLAPFGQRLAEELSGGMKQKLALACTLVHSPTTILLDEPTAGVDPVSRREFWRMLYRINRGGTTIFVSTPYMDEAERAHRVAFITHGSILSCGTPAELRAHLSGEVIEITAPDRGALRRVLREEPLVRSVEIFGEAVHALVTSAAQAQPAIDARLQRAGLHGASMRVVPASLEDAFVARLQS